jgi:hypothetical protein
MARGEAVADAVSGAVAEIETTATPIAATVSGSILDFTPYHRHRFRRSAYQAGENRFQRPATAEPLLICDKYSY